MPDHRDRLSNLEAALQGLKLVTNGMDDLQAQYPPLPKDTDKLSTHQRLTALEKAHDNFRIVGGANTQVSGSLKHGFCINNSCPGEAGEQGSGGAINIPPAVYGACCFDDGSCSVTTQIACTSAMGTYQGDGTDCDPNPCPQPTTGACCHDTTCDIETEADCTGSGGTYQGDDTTCDPNPCGETPTGACCHADGTCTIEASAGCDGTYLGDGTTCSMGICGSTGTCCYNIDTCARSFSCATIDATGCAMLGGGHFDSHGLTCFDRCVCLDSFDGLDCGACFHGPCPITCNDFDGTPYECCNQGGGFSWACLTCFDGDCRQGVGCEDMVACTGTCFGGCIDTPAEDCECACTGGSVILGCGSC